MHLAPTPTRAVVCAFLIAACGDDAPTEWAGTVTDSAGVVLVSNPSEGAWTANEAWTVEEVMRIGSLTGDPVYQFGQVGTIAIASGGEILVSDRQAQEIRVFTPTGEYVRTIGGPGSGPGQFSLALSEIFLTAGDTLVVPDIRNQRVHRFSFDGTPLGDVRIDLTEGRPLRYDWSPRSRAAAVQLRPTAPQGEAPVSEIDAIRRVEPSGAFGDTLLTVPSGGLFAGEGIRYFTSEPMWAMTDSLTILYAVNSTYRIGAYDRDGALRQLISKEASPRPITDRDIRALFVYLDRAWLDAGVPPARLPANRAAVSFAEFFPAFNRFDTGPQGTLWVQPIQSPADLSDDEIERYNFLEDFGGPNWDVFDAEGRFLGVVPMPHRFQPRLFFEDRIYGVWRDELDVQYVVQLRIRMEGGA